eukprot:scaffold1726_cov260-Pinguiococcus_pyrenoidosus.AAC.23
MSSGLLCLRGRLAVAVRHGPSAARWRHVGGFRRSMSKETKVGDVVPIKFLKGASFLRGQGNRLLYFQGSRVSALWKVEQEEIKIMEDDQYPEWLWELPVSTYAKWHRDPARTAIPMWHMPLMWPLAAASLSFTMDSSLPFSSLLFSCLVLS